MNDGQSAAISPDWDRNKELSSLAETPNLREAVEPDSKLPISDERIQSFAHSAS